MERWDEMVGVVLLLSEHGLLWGKGRPSDIEVSVVNIKLSRRQLLHVIMSRILCAPYSQKKNQMKEKVSFLLFQPVCCKKKKKVKLRPRYY